MNQSIWEIIEHGGYAMYAILGMSVLAAAVALERLIAQWQFIGRARLLADTVSRCLARGAIAEGRSACERSSSPLADVFLVGYERYGRTSADKVASAAHRERLRVVSALKTRMWIMGTIGALAPFVGLLGTVIGILTAFGDIAEAGETNIAIVAGGISEALWATAFGILVALEAVVFYNFFNQRLAGISLELKLLTDEFLEMLDDLGPEDGKRAGDDEGGEKKKDGHRSAA